MSQKAMKPREWRRRVLATSSPRRIAGSQCNGLRVWEYWNRKLVLRGTQMVITQAFSGVNLERNSLEYSVGNKGGVSGVSERVNPGEGGHID